MKKVHFKTTINCNNCLASVTPNLNMLENVESWKVDLDHPDKILEVDLDDDNVQSIISTVQSAGYEIELIRE